MAKTVQQRRSGPGLAHQVWLAVSTMLIIGVLLALPTVVHAQDQSTPTVDVAKIFAGGAPNGVADLKAMEQHIQAVAKKVIPCTVGVLIGNAQGSGVIISEDGYVLTAAHVAGKPNRDAMLVMPNGKMVKAKTLGMDYSMDAGLLKITETGKWPHVERGDSSRLKEGQWILGTGHPNGYQRGRKPVLRMGRVLSNRRDMVITDVALVGGDSGGPLFDMDGKVIGIHSRIGDKLTDNIHVPVSTYNDTWDRLAKGEEWGFLPGQGPFIGVKGDPEANEAKILEVFPGTPAAKAGVKSGDVITKFDGHEINDFPTLAQLVREKKPDEKVKMEVTRDEKTVRLQIVIGRRGE